MSDTLSVAASKTDHQLLAKASESLPEPLAVISLALQSIDAAKHQFPNYRLTQLVGARIELDELDIAKLPGILGIDILCQVPGVLRPFNDHLRRVISDYGLEQLFFDDGFAPYHHAIRPTGYDFYRDEVIPLGMEQWRADYRSMADERQMLAASIMWLYRAGKDNVWLRRVPCTWHAVDAIECMRSNNVLADWARLFALYPGW
jgi:hypothetical protein